MKMVFLSVTLCLSELYIKLLSHCKNTDMEVKSINDVPNEVIQKNIMSFLSNEDIRSFGITGSKRFKVIADDELEKRRK